MNYQLPNFLIPIKTLGKGAFSEVLLCHDTALNNEQFAVQVVNVRPDIAKSLYGYDEAGSVSRVGKLYQHSRDNPWVPEIRWIRSGSKETTLVCHEFKGECTLEDLLKQNPSTARLRSIADEIIKGIAFAHDYEKGVVHNDIKPSNIIIDPRHKPWIIDFNISFYEGEKPPRHGHITYRAPETFNKKADKRSDVWSLGVLLYEMFTKRLPFESDVRDWSSVTEKQKQGYRQQVIDRILTEPPYPPRLHNLWLPRDINLLIHKLLQKDPEQRPPNAQEVLNQWKQFENQPKIALACGLGFSLSMSIFYLLTT